MKKMKEEKIEEKIEEKTESKDLEMASEEISEELQSETEDTESSGEEAGGADEEAADSENKEEKSAESSPDSPDEGKIKKGSGIKESFGTKSVLYGSYSAAVTAIVIAIAVVINLIASALPAGIQSFDLSANKVYSIGKQTEKVLDQLDSDVSITVFSSKDSVHETLRKLLDNYDANKRITVEYVDPALNPSIVQDYYGVTQGSLVVKSGSRERTIDSSEIYVSDYSSYSTNFDGEGQITSAIQYVTSEDQLKMYTVSGHGESDMSSTVSSLVSKQNIEVEELNMMAQGSIPDDCDVLFIYAPGSDYSEEEAGAVIDYLDKGGKVIAIENYTEETLTNFQSILNACGLQTEDGIVLETANHYYQSPLNILPVIASSDITKDLLEEKRNLLVPGALAMVENGAEDVEVTPLLQTSGGAYLKKVVNGELESPALEDGDEKGPFLLAALSEKNSENGGALIAVSSLSLIDDAVTQISSLGNLDFFTSCLSYLVSQEGTESVSIEAKSMNAETITVSAMKSVIWAALLIIIIPAAIIVTGLIVWFRRRKK